MKISQKIGYSLLGFPIASFFIFIVYLLIYLVLGESTYMTEIIKLCDINILLRELIVLGVGIFISIFALLMFFDLSSRKAKKAIPSLILIFICLILLVLGFAFVPVLASQLFLNDLSIVNLTFFIVWLLFVTVFSLIEVIKEFASRWILVKNTNKKNSKDKKESNTTDSK